ncbi:hypothetical protein NE596_16170, partial [Desulfovibrio desulfuricans]|uniref:hypothetical protein n=1 Tax=Desulfovibrio desulfuricans TaxID=876 RepID=UPI003F7407B2|nr:hypothetical protein [Desulfovibrio desulfuricans]
RSPHSIIDTDRYSLVECYEQLRDLTLDALAQDREWAATGRRMLPQASGPFMNAAIALYRGAPDNLHRQVRREMPRSTCPRHALRGILNCQSLL